MTQTTIYLIKRNYQEYDGDGYHHWRGEKIVGYHLSEDAARLKIESLVAEVYQQYKGSSHTTNVLIMNNEVEIIEGTGDRCARYPIFEVISQAVEP